MYYYGKGPYKGFKRDSLLNKTHFAGIHTLSGCNNCCARVQHSNTKEVL